MTMSIVLAAAVSQHAPAVVMPAEVCLRLVETAQEMNRAGLKGFGLLTADASSAGWPPTVADVLFLDPQKNHRNDAEHRSAFHAQGEYFRQYDDAGFVADSTELLNAFRSAEQAGQEIVAPFHVHRRQPANFSSIDYRLHNPNFRWHLIVSLRDPDQPVIQPFAVHKPALEYGISDHDDRQGSEFPYDGPEVQPLGLVAEGPDSVLRQLSAVVNPQRIAVA